MSLSRKHFLKQAGALSLGFSGLRMLNSFVTPGQAPHELITEPFGPLQADPAKIFDLPKDFSYKIISTFGDAMDDGLKVPHRPDGMATFPGLN